MVARETGTSSEAGGLVDAAIDRYNELFLLAGSLIFFRDVVWAQLLVLGALAGSFMVSYASAKGERRGFDAPRGLMRRPERALVMIVGAAAATVVGAVGWHGPLTQGIPLLIAAGFIALAANGSAIRRFTAVARALESTEDVSGIHETRPMASVDAVIKREVTPEPEAA